LSGAGHTLSVQDSICCGSGRKHLCGLLCPQQASCFLRLLTVVLTCCLLLTMSWGVVLTCCACAKLVLLQTFVDAAILAYECGMNEDSLRHELKVYKASLEQQVAPPGMVSSSLLRSTTCLRLLAAALPATLHSAAAAHASTAQLNTQFYTVCILQVAERRSWVSAQIGRAAHGRCVLSPQRNWQTALFYGCQSYVSDSALHPFCCPCRPSTRTAACWVPRSCG
jgi:hypothetical protein